MRGSIPPAGRMCVFLSSSSSLAVIQLVSNTAGYSPHSYVGRVLHFYLAVVRETGRGKDLGRAGEEETRVAWPIASPPIHGISWLADGGGSTPAGALLPGWAGNRPAAGGFSDTCQAPADELLLCASASARPGNFQIFVLCFPVRNDLHSP